MPESLQIDTFQALRGNQLPYLWLIFWDNNIISSRSNSSHTELPTLTVCFKVHLLRTWKLNGLSEPVPTRVHITEKQTQPSVPPWMQIPNSKLCFWHHSMHSSNLYWRAAAGATAQAPLKARYIQAQKLPWAGHRSSSSWSAAEEKQTGFCFVCSSTQRSCYSPGTRLCLRERHTVQRFKTWSSNSKRHSIYLLIVVNF